MKNLFKLQHCIHPLLSILNCRPWIQTRDTLTWMLGMALLLVCQDVAAQIDLVKNGKARATIVLENPTERDFTAAHILQLFVHRISEAQLPIVTDRKVKKGEIQIGGTAPAGVTEDGYSLSTSGGILRISGKDNGVVYGVVSLLEDYLGIDYWGKNEYSLTPSRNVSLPLIEKIDNPAFCYRQTQCYAKEDSIYKWWYRLEEPAEAFAAGYWVHTFDKLLPSSVYGEKHPEYYSYFNGKRHPGQASQWCLTNPEVFEIVAQRIDSIFKANPGQTRISVSQNDGNYTNCACPECKKIDDREGSPAGSLIYFMNKLAARFPDKEFSTLAYLYSMNPPKHIKPLPNVLIMLCNIDCEREVSLTENASGQHFMKAMKGWSEISDNIFVWDYGINFDGYLTPFPNLHILQDNIRLFRDYHVTMHFSQIAGSYCGDFSELRAYLVSKLMWNPDVDADVLMKHFLNGYYGAAGEYLYQYIKVMEGALLGSGHRLWINDSPVSHKKGMLNPALMRRYAAIFDAAEKAVAGNETFAERVRRARLPLLFSELELLRTDTDKDFSAVAEKLDHFEKEAAHFDNPLLNSRSNYALEYCKLYRERYMPSTKANLAKGAAVKFLIEPTGKYAELGRTALTDGLYGGTTFMESWVGWEGKDGAFVIDLGEVKRLQTVSVDFLYLVSHWILLPLEVSYSYSSDGENYTLWDKVEIPEERSRKVLFRSISAKSPQPINARYVKVEVNATKVCPHWHYGVGHPSWFFIDEVVLE